MELKASAHEPAHSPSISESNPDEKEISDDDDNDRNHKHRRRDDARSQSQEPDAVEQVFTKPYRKGNKPFENDHSYRETGSQSQSGEPWKSYNSNPMDSKFDKRRPGFTQSSHGPLDLNQRIRGRGRETGLWNQPVHPGLFGGRGLPNVSNAYGANWGAFGLVPGMPGGGMDSLHPLGLQGAYRSINPSMNMGLGLARQRCRDFEEQGFCLRGDMCLMEHGVNRIVVEDVQSLSQFNLPVSLQNANMTGAPGAPTNSFKPSHGKTSKRGAGPNGHGLSEADFYDPDQPLWGNDSQTSPALQSINQSNVKETGPMFDPGPSGDHCVGPLDGSDEHVVKSGGTGTLTLLGRMTSTENKTGMVSKSSPSVEKHNDANSLSKMQSGNGKSARKPSQKAQCTLFVNGIPLQQNKRESLLSHFHKFGEVIDIYIPSNSERAFVQFSKREEAEAALMAPDAVMGNRFIKLFWGNRDNIPIPIPIPINGTNSGYNNAIPPIPPCGMTVSSTLHNPKTAPTTTTVPIINGPKPHPLSQKKMENLEVLKEELRKKQEMLDQKRNDFKRKLDKLAKQALKGEIESEQVAKKPKLGIVIDSTQAATSISTDPETVLSSPGTQVISNGNKSMESVVPKSYKSTAMIALPETPVLKPLIRPLVPIGTSVVTNPFKLDNRPTAFKIISTLPNDLANDAVLKEHFSAFGDLSKIELDDPQTAKCSVRVYFTTRHSAEKAFSSGKCWNGHNLQFSWLRSSPVSSSKGNSDASTGPADKIPKTDSQKPITSGDVESEKVNQMDIEKEHTEPDESIHNHVS